MAPSRSRFDAPLPFEEFAKTATYQLSWPTMCRLFGFRSVMQSGVHESLVSADNALMLQSERHPDGWGVAYYLAGAPHVIKSASTAVSDRLFRHVSGIVSSETVIAHLRRATQGEKTIVDTHPFQFGHWVMAHNGNLRDFEHLAPAIRQKISPILRRFILGTTDSELLFYLVLTKMAQRCELERRGYPLEAIAESVSEAIDELCAIAGPLCPDDDASPDNNFLTFVLTNGRAMLAHEGGKALYISTHKKRCPERDHCPYFAEECESAKAHGFVSHFVVSSEPLSGDNVWRRMPHRHMAGVDFRMQLAEFSA